MGFFNNLFGANGQPYSDFANQENSFANEYNPWVNTGQNANNFLYGQYQQNANNPNQLQNQLMNGYQNSPFQQNLLNQTTNRMNMNAANTGMLGSGASNVALGQQLNDMTGQFQNNYVDRGLGIYNNSMQGMQGLDSLGLQALGGKTGMQEAGAIANLKAAQTNNSLWPNVIGGTLGLVSSAANGGFGKGLQGMFGQGQQQGQQQAQSNPYGGGYGAGATGSWGGVPMAPPSGGFGGSGGGGSSFDLGSLMSMMGPAMMAGG